MGTFVWRQGAGPTKHQALPAEEINMSHTCLLLYYFFHISVGAFVHTIL